MNAFRTLTARVPIASTSRAVPRRVQAATRYYASTPTPPTPSSSRPDPAGANADGGKARDKAAVGAFTWKAAGLFLVTGAGLYLYFESEKAKVQERRRQELLTTSVGKPNIGGPFSLQSHHTPPQTFTEANLQGNWSLIYFGFTNCPDICPEELDKMGEVVETVEKKRGLQVLPIFISCDPARDTIEQVRHYVKDFHPRLVGLTGTYDAVKKACKSYRVYFSTPPDAEPTDDYLVDHSIFFYLMDPNGQFVDAFGKNSTAADVVHKLDDAVNKWEKAGGK